MNTNPNFALLPSVVLSKIFHYSKFDDLFNLQKVCPKFREVIDNIKRDEIQNDWRLDYLKYEKFQTEISATGAIKSLEMAKIHLGKFTFDPFCPKSTIGKYALINSYYINFKNLAIDAFNEVIQIILQYGVWPINIAVTKN